MSKNNFFEYYYKNEEFDINIVICLFNIDN
jgi:hypothetical protein